MLYEWMNKNGDSATVQCLFDALENIEQTKIAQKLLEKEIKSELNSARAHSARLRERAHIMTAGLEKEQQKDNQTKEKLAEVINCLHELLTSMDKDDKPVTEARVKELENTIKRLNEELSTEKSEKEALREEMARLSNLSDKLEENVCILKESLEKISEGGKELKENDVTLPDYNNNNVLNVTTCCEEGTLRQGLNGPELATCEREENATFHDRLTKSPVDSIKIMFRGNQACSRCHDLEKELDTLKTKIESEKSKIKHNEKEKTLKEDKKDDETSVTQSRETNTRRKKPDPALEEQIQDFVKEKNDIERELRREKKTMEKELNNKIEELNKKLVKALRRNESVSKENEKLKREKAKIEKEGDKSGELEKIKTECDQLSSQMKERCKQVQNEAELKCKKLEGQNARYRKQCRTLEQQLEALKAEIKSWQNKIKQLGLKHDEERQHLEKEKDHRDTKIKEYENEIKELRKDNVQQRQREEIPTKAKNELERGKLEPLSENAKPSGITQKVPFEKIDNALSVKSGAAERAKHDSTEIERLHAKLKESESKCQRLQEIIGKYKNSMNRNQTCSRCHDSEEELDALKTNLESEQVKQQGLETTKTRTEESKTRELNKVKIEREQLFHENKRLRKEVEALEKEMLKCRNRVNRVLLTNGKDFSSSPGVVRALLLEGSSTLVASRSSDGVGQASDIFDHQKGKTCGTEEKRDSWWCIDLSENYLLVATHYALRHGKSDGESYLLQWQLQGSLDGITWTNLETCHKRDNPSDPPQFRDPHPYFTGLWSIKGKVGAFRCFRILQTGRNSSGKYGIYLSGVELYGALSEV